jgi:thiol-disulfide isomerase/thioredoxin
VVAGFGGKVRFQAENYGDSALAKRFGVTRYPAIFVNDVLVAKPKDFGFYGKGEGAGDGRYTPLKSAKSHGLFRADLTRMLELVLAGRLEEARARGATLTPELGAMPEFALTGLDGRALSRETFRGKVVVVEFWATWCPPCAPTLRWLGELKKRHGDRLEVLAVAVESEEADVRKLRDGLGLPFAWAMATPEVVRAFDDVTAVPTLRLFDGRGQAVGAFYGAPPELHGLVEAKLHATLEAGLQ